MRPDETRREEKQPAAAKRAGEGRDPEAQAEAAPKPAGRAGGDALRDERIVTALRAAADKKAVASTLLDLRELASFTDYFLITSGTNARQVQAIADEVVERLKRAGTRAQRVEGYKSAEWVLIDYGDFIFHVFDEKSRRFFDLERLWRDGARVELPRELAGEPGLPAGGGDNGGRADAET